MYFYFLISLFCVAGPMNTLGTLTQRHIFTKTNASQPMSPDPQLDEVQGIIDGVLDKGPSKSSLSATDDEYIMNSGTKLR